MRKPCLSVAFSSERKPKTPRLNLPGRSFRPKKPAPFLSIPQHPVTESQAGIKAQRRSEWKRRDWQPDSSSLPVCLCAGADLTPSVCSCFGSEITHTCTNAHKSVYEPVTTSDCTRGRLCGCSSSARPPGGGAREVGRG